MQWTPGILFNRSTMKRRRLSNSVTMAVMNGSPWLSAVTAAFCAMELGFDVLWLCTVPIAEITSTGPAE